MEGSCCEEGEPGVEKTEPNTCERGFGAIHARSSSAVRTSTAV